MQDDRIPRVFHADRLPRLLAAVEDPTGDGQHRLADDGPVSWAESCMDDDVPYEERTHE